MQKSSKYEFYFNQRKLIKRATQIQIKKQQYLS